MNSAILGPFMEIIGIASSHFVEYSVAVIMNLWSPNDVGDIFPIRSKAYHENGHRDCINYKDWEG